MNITNEYILSLLAGSSRENPVKRSTIEDRLSVSKRKAEILIGNLREEGYRICGMSGTSGYYLAKDEKEFKDFLHDYEARAWTTIRRSRRMQFTVPKQISMCE